jgi:GNAT superfamily N-acetyltransferase
MQNDSSKALQNPALVKIRASQMQSAGSSSGGLCAGDEILFRRLDAPVASWSYPAIRWSVEYWRKEMAFPVAQAWVCDSPYGPYIDWLHVMEGHRRQGIGRALFAAIRRRWPDVEFDAVTDDGELFLSGLPQPPPDLALIDPSANPC